MHRHARAREIHAAKYPVYVSFDGANEMDQMDDAKLRKREKSTLAEKLKDRKIVIELNK